MRVREPRLWLYNIVPLLPSLLWPFSVARSLRGRRVQPGFSGGHCKVAFRRDRLEQPSLSSGRPLSPFDHPAMLFRVLPLQRASPGG